MNDTEITQTARLALTAHRQHRRSGSHVALAFFNGLTGRLEDAGVTERDLERLRLVDEERPPLGFLG